MHFKVEYCQITLLKPTQKLENKCLEINFWKIYKLDLLIFVKTVMHLLKNPTWSYAATKKDFFLEKFGY